MQNVYSEEQEFYRKVLGALNVSSIDFLVGGGFAFEQYTGIQRSTKDCDIFVRKDDCQRVLNLFEAAQYKSTLIFPHWLGKIIQGNYTIDVIFNSGNGTSAVDDEWFQHAVNAEVLGIPVKLVPPEEMIQSKAYIMERERYDGADVAHIIHSHGQTMDWVRLVRRMGSHWKVLFSHIVLYGFVFPSEQKNIPFWLVLEFSRRFSLGILDTSERNAICNGTFLSRQQYLDDIRKRGYEDGRRVEPAAMSQDDIDKWTEAIGH